METIGTGSEKSVQQLGDIARALLDQRDRLVSRAGGMTPEQLQEMAGTWAEAVNPDFSVRSIPQLLTDLAKEYAVIYDDAHEATVQEWGAALTLIAMHVASRNVFDLYEATFEFIGETLENVCTLAREAQEREAKRSAHNPV